MAVLTGSALNINNASILTYQTAGLFAWRRSDGSLDTEAVLLEQPLNARLSSASHKVLAPAPPRNVNTPNAARTE